MSMSIATLGAKGAPELLSRSSGPCSSAATRLQRAARPRVPVTALAQHRSASSGPLLGAAHAAWPGAPVHLQRKVQVWSRAFNAEDALAAPPSAVASRAAAAAPLSDDVAALLTNAAAALSSGSGSSNTNGGGPLSASTNGNGAAASAAAAADCGNGAAAATLVGSPEQNGHASEAVLLGDAGAAAAAAAAAEGSAASNGNGGPAAAALPAGGPPAAAAAGEPAAADLAEAAPAAAAAAAGSGAGDGAAALAPEAAEAAVAVQEASAAVVEEDVASADAGAAADAAADAAAAPALSQEAGDAAAAAASSSDSSSGSSSSSAPPASDSSSSSGAEGTGAAAGGGPSVRLLLHSGAAMLPHPDKAHRGGEDSFFIADHQAAVGVADGVGGWAEIGVDAGAYARLLMVHAKEAADAAGEDVAAGTLSAQAILESAFYRTNVQGSSTACVLVVNGTTLSASNLGDSGFVLVRDGVATFQCPQQQHNFNFPFQLGSADSMSDQPQAAMRFELQLQPGDIVVTGSDGLWDNIFAEEAATIASKCRDKGETATTAAQVLCRYARMRASDAKYHSPFSYAAIQAGYVYLGGKLDDITVVVSYVTVASKL